VFALLVVTSFGTQISWAVMARPMDLPENHSTTPAFLLFLEFDVDEIAFKRSAIELGDSNARFVAFHLDKAKAFALT
jgi:hypothetical protein